MMMVVELHAFTRHLVELWRLEPGISLIGYITVALVIGDYENDVWARPHVRLPEPSRPHAQPRR